MHVCTTLTADGRNFARCPKCLRTQLTLEITGRLESYGQTFDLEVYHSLRSAYRDQAAWARDAYTAEIRDFAQRMNFPLPSVGGGLVRHGLRRAARKAVRIRGRFDRARSGESLDASTG